MQVQRIQNNDNYKPTFCAKYVVIGSFHDMNTFYGNLDKAVPNRALIMLGSCPDRALVGTDKESKNAIGTFGSTLMNEFQHINKKYNEFVKLPLDYQLYKIFGVGAKDVKRYNVQDILKNPNFDYIEGK